VTDLRIAQDEQADRLLAESPLALLLGMALDQHVVAHRNNRLG
jgi:hypothetical protein